MVKGRKLWTSEKNCATERAHAPTAMICLAKKKTPEENVAANGTWCKTITTKSNAHKRRPYSYLSGEVTDDVGEVTAPEGSETLLLVHTGKAVADASVAGHLAGDDAGVRVLGLNNLQEANGKSVKNIENQMRFSRCPRSIRCARQHLF